MLFRSCWRRWERPRGSARVRCGPGGRGGEAPGVRGWGPALFRRHRPWVRRLGCNTLGSRLGGTGGPAGSRSRRQAREGSWVESHPRRRQARRARRTLRAWRRRACWWFGHKCPGLAVMSSLPGASLFVGTPSARLPGEEASPPAAPGRGRPGEVPCSCPQRRRHAVRGPGPPAERPTGPRGRPRGPCSPEGRVEGRRPAPPD